MSLREIKAFDDGFVIWGDFPSDDITNFILNNCPKDGIPLVIMDPDYDKLVQDNSDMDVCAFMCRCFKILEDLCCKGAATYLFGGVGDIGYRPFYRLIIKLEHCTSWKMINKIIWRKRRSISGIMNYDECYDEIGFFVLGDELVGKIPSPKVFNTPFLDKQKTRFGRRNILKGKDVLCRRNNVWIDISEMIKNKISKNQKPEKLIEIPIRTHTKNGEYILDPFSRHGISAITARKLGRKFLVIERDRLGFEMCVNELSKIKRQSIIIP